MTLSLVCRGCLLGVEILRGLPKRPGGTAGWEGRSVLVRRRVGRGPKRAHYIGVS